MRYLLRSQKLKGEFIQQIRELSKKCYDYFLSDNDLIESEEAETGKHID